MDTATYWTAVGSVGTAAGSFFAFFAIVLTAFLYRRQRNDEQAAQIREDKRAFVSATASLIRILRDGSLLISAAWATRAVIQESLLSNSDVNDLREALKGGDLGLSVAVVGWERSSEAEAFRSLVDALVVSARRMTGNLNILSNAGEILLTIVDDSKMTFLRLLTEEQVVTMFLDRTEGIADVEKLLNALAKHLHGNTVMYFVARYENVVRSLDELITETAVAIGELDAARLVAVARAKSAITTDTRTAEMRAHLFALHQYIPAATSSKLRQLINRIEQEVSKDSARGRLGGEAETGAS